MVSSLAVFGLVVNGTSLDLNLTDAQVPLEVGHIVHGIPETEFYIGEKREILFLRGGILQSEKIDLTGSIYRYESKKLCTKPVLAALKMGVSHSVSALIGVQLCTGWHVSRVPDGSVIIDIVILSIGIIGNIVITVAGDAEKLGIFIEAVASAGIGDQAEKVLGTKIVDPWQRRAWSGDDVLAGFIVEMSEFPINPPYKK